uniref:Uncharacterized protein n=1 Tax=Streptomyces sp. NBC_00093 TaxID=2975649 RepID=A0AAU2A127_9ACTN
MGFSGELVFGRSDRSLLEAPVFDGVREVPDAVWATGPRPGGWQTLQFRYGVLADLDEVLLPGLVECTGSAACVASVYDSGVALVTGLGPEGERWEACLNLELAAAIWTDVPDDVDDTSAWADSPEFAEAVSRTRAELDAEVPGSARRAVAWARSAGLGRDIEVGTVEEVLRSREAFVEDLFTTLLDRLGFPQAPEDSDDDEEAGRNGF